MAGSLRQGRIAGDRGKEDGVPDHGPDRPNGQARSRAVLGELASVETWIRGVGGGERETDHEREFGVRTLTVGGMHDLVAVTGRATAGDPQPAAVGAAETRVLGSVVRGLLDLAGYEAGAAHTVVALTGRGARVVACTGPFDDTGPYDDTDADVEADTDADARLLPGTSGLRGTGGEPFGKADDHHQ
ncbi:MAG: hypothetical protein ACRD0H_04905 [Actinomycetes bacterium]